MRLREQSREGQALRLDTSLCKFSGNFSNAGGVLDFFIDTAHIKELFPAGMTKAQFTYQLSDHLPLWIQINTDIDGEQLQQIIQA